MFKRFEQPYLGNNLERDPKKLSYADRVNLIESLKNYKETLINQIGDYEKLLRDPQVKNDIRLIKIHTEAQTSLQDKLIRTNKLLIKAQTPE